MRGLMRLLMMFGPMIVRGIMRQQNRRGRGRQGGYQDRQQRWDPRYDQRTDDRMGRRRNRPVRTHNPTVATPPPPAPPRKPKKTEEQINFELTEEDIMLDNETMKDYQEELRNNNNPLVIEEAEVVNEDISEDIKSLDLSENPIADAETKGTEAKKAPEIEEDKMDLDLKNIFFDEDESET